VRDISHAETAAQRADVHAVLKDLGITPETAGGRVLEVWNKVDRLDAEKRQEIENMARRIEPPPILVSAVTGEGIAGLLSEFERRLGVADEVMDVTLPPGSGKLAHWLHENAEVLSRQMDDDGATHFRIRIDHSRKARLEARMRGAA
ncbi:MAG: GTPase HflX, partial [Hyphomicrobiaceae bacterium]